MPFVSKAQMAKFRVLVAEGKITQDKFDEWEAETPDIHKLPRRLHKKTEKPASKPAARPGSSHAADRLMRIVIGRKK